MFAGFSFLGGIAPEILLTLVQLNGNLCMVAGNGESKTFSIIIYHEKKNSLLMKYIFSHVLTGIPNHFLPFIESF